MYFDPALPESREYICKIVTDIVSRYDVDAIHMDDYFYPYPIKESIFPITQVLPVMAEALLTRRTGDVVM